MDPSKTLKSILAIISKDVRLIKKTTKKTQLPTETALTLSRYATTLNGIVEEQRKEKDRAKKRFEKMPTDELLKAYHDSVTPKPKGEEKL